MLKKIVILGGIIGIVAIIAGFIYEGENTQYPSVSNVPSDTVVEKPHKYCFVQDNGRCAYEANLTVELNINGHDVWMTNRLSDEEDLTYIEYNGSRYFYDEIEVTRNYSIYPVFSNGTDRITVVSTGKYNFGINKVRKYISPYNATLNAKYDVLKVVLSPEYVIYYWNNETLITLVPTENDVVETIRSNDNSLTLVREYHDNWLIIRYWRLNINKVN